MSAAFPTRRGNRMFALAARRGVRSPMPSSQSRHNLGPCSRSVYLANFTSTGNCATWLLGTNSANPRSVRTGSLCTSGIFHVA